MAEQTRQEQLEVIHNWYAPKEIIFSRSQMIWLIEWLDWLSGGRWPPNPQQTGYTESPNVQRSRSRRAIFEIPSGIAGEVKTRLRMCGIEGKLLKSEIQAGKGLEELEPESRQALNYVSGWRRRRMPFKKWCNQQERRQNEAILASNG